MDELQKQVFSALKEIPIDFFGGCSVTKAYLMAWLIREYKLATSIDIGVYRGRSLFPQAIAHACSGNGVAYGVDPWLGEEAREKDNPELRDKIDRFIDNTDFSSLYADVDSLRHRLRLDRHCILLRQTSSDAIHYFDERGITFDFIHIDGNHDRVRLMEDLACYLPKLNKRGFLVMDDISWASVKPGVELAQKRLHHVYQLVDRSNDFAVFWDASSWLASRLLRRRLRLQSQKWRSSSDGSAVGA